MVQLLFSRQYVKSLSFQRLPSKNVSAIVNRDRKIFPPSLLYWRVLHSNWNRVILMCAVWVRELNLNMPRHYHFYNNHLPFFNKTIHRSLLILSLTAHYLLFVSLFLPLSVVCVAWPTLSCLWMAAAGTGRVVWRPPTVHHRPGPPAHTAAAAPPCSPLPCVSPAAVSRAHTGSFNSSERRWILNHRQYKTRWLTVTGNQLQYKVRGEEEWRINHNTDH